MNKKILTSLFSFLLTATSVSAGTLQYSTDKGAIDGYDVVSYFTLYGTQGCIYNEPTKICPTIWRVLRLGYGTRR